MNLLRVVAFGTVTGLGSLSVGLVTADRLAHPAVAATPVQAAIHAAPARPEPATTGTVTQGAQTPEPARGRMLTGFDTERLNALMRGETTPAATRRR